MKKIKKNSKIKYRAVKEKKLAKLYVEKSRKKNYNDEKSRKNDEN